MSRILEKADEGTVSILSFEMNELKSNENKQTKC
jgi:hypothetical protein